MGTTLAERALTPGWDSPAIDAFAITPSDATNFTQGPVRAIYVGSPGTIQVVTMKDQVVPFVCTAGALIPVMCKRINFTSTTASNLVGLL